MLLRAGGQGKEPLRVRIQPPHVRAPREDRRGGGRFHVSEQLAPARIARQHAQIGHALRDILRRDAEVSGEQQPPQPRVGVALGLRRGEDAVDRRLALHGVVEAVVKPLTAAVEGGEVLLAHRTQTGEDRPLGVCHRHRRTARRALARADRRALRREKFVGARAVYEQLADVARGGEALRCAAVVPDAPSRQRQRLHHSILTRDGFAVFHAQNVVRLREDGGLLTEQLACGGFARRGEGDALL